MFKNFSLTRNKILIGIAILILIITGASLLRINYNQRIVDAYDALSHPLPERTRIAVFEAVWQKYTGFTRRQFVTEGDARTAQRTIENSYNFMIGADVVLLIAMGAVILRPIISERFKK